ncbi:phage/plasmid primase, P4 family, partial [Marivita sp.]|uniref:phage/plasmid primase, P4 family n=1 Tax=Marivita sp. TaxID=2003365 RepID=UPI0025C44320
HLMPWAQQLIDRCGSYAEWTPSGNGARILGCVPEGFRSIHTKRNHDKGGEYEIYSNVKTGRYITVSGQQIEGTPSHLADLHDAIEYLESLTADDDDDQGNAGQRTLDLGDVPVWVRTYIEHGGSGDRSGDFQSIVNALRPRGWSFDAVLKLLQDNPQGPAGKYIEGNRLETELRRSWDKATGGSATSDGRPRPNAPDEIDLSQDGLANNLGKQGWDNDARHVAAWGKWLFWTGTRWEVDDKRKHMTLTRQYLRQRAEELIDWTERRVALLEEQPANKLRRWAQEQARTLRSKNTVAAIEALAQSNPASAAHPDEFDKNKMLLGTPGGVVDLTTGQLRPAQRGDMLTKLTTCEPATPGSTPSLWLQFLHDIFEGDAELIEFMQRAAGYALTGLTTEHKLLFLYGTGRNGKSVFLNTLTHIWGDYSRRAAAETFLNSQGDKHATGLAGLQGARLVAGSELPVGKTWDESVIKDLTGGDRMTARFMRGDFFDFDPQLTLMIAGNNQPSFRGVDEAIRARVVLVPFKVTIPPEKRDKGLADKLLAEGPAILRWAIDGALQWQARGLDVPVKVQEASAEYMDDEDTLGQFLADETTADSGGFVSNADLHVRFAYWCEKQGLRPWTQHTLTKEMKSRGFEVYRRTNARGFVGVRLR